MRLSARAILFNKADDSILLIKHLDLESESTKEFTQGFWALPGGGLKPSETFEQGLMREIHEETGIKDIKLVRCVMSRLVNLDINQKKRNYYERYFLAETAERQINPAGLTANEKKQLVAFKWWKIPEIGCTDELIFPRSLAKNLDKLFADASHVIDITDPAELLNSTSHSKT